MRELSQVELRSVSGGWDPYHNPLDPFRDVTDFSDEPEAYIVVPSGAWVADSDGNLVQPDVVTDEAHFYFGADDDEDGYVDRLEGGTVYIMHGLEIIETPIPTGPGDI